MAGPTGYTSLLACTVILLLAGCTEPQGAGPKPPAVEEPAPVVYSGDVSLAVARPSSVGEDEPNQRVAFEVPHGATFVLAEARWECASPTCDFRLQIWSGQEVLHDGNRAFAATRLGVIAPPAGAYEAKLTSADPALGMTGEVRVTVFFTADEPPAGYSAFG